MLSRAEGINFLIVNLQSNNKQNEPAVDDYIVTAGSF